MADDTLKTKFGVKLIEDVTEIKKIYAVSWFKSVEMNNFFALDDFRSNQKIKKSKF